MVAGAISKAITKIELSQDIFIHLNGASHAVGEALVKNEHAKAVGFTGSFTGGMALFNWANQRKEPIPVFAEMGSVNPVFLLEEKLSSDPAGIAKIYADSISLGVGQFCTNPGIIIGIDSPAMQAFISFLGEKLDAITVGKMLHQGIADAYIQKATTVLQHAAVSTVSSSLDATGLSAPRPIIASVSASAFLENPSLKEEVFGPFSLVVVCSNVQEMKAVAVAMDGQLTSTIMATEKEALANTEIIDLVAEKCGRIIMNGVPTGVEVCYAMQHGGPFPASTDPRFTSVGPDAIKRFARPMSFQNYPNALLPDELKAENPLMIHRIIE